MFGTFWRKLVRRDATHTSQEAAYKVKTTKMEKLVYETIKAFPDGASQDDILYALDGLPYSTVTARFPHCCAKDWCMTLDAPRLASLDASNES